MTTPAGGVRQWAERGKGRRPAARARGAGGLESSCTVGHSNVARMPLRGAVSRALPYCTHPSPALPAPAWTLNLSKLQKAPGSRPSLARGSRSSHRGQTHFPSSTKCSVGLRTRGASLGSSPGPHNGPRLPPFHRGETGSGKVTCPERPQASEPLQPRALSFLIVHWALMAPSRRFTAKVKV